MEIICTKCKSDKVYIVDNNKEETKTIDEMVGEQVQNLVYKMTTWKCKDCGYEVCG